MDDEFDCNDYMLAGAASVLAESGKAKAAALLLDARLSTEKAGRPGLVSTRD